MPETDDRHERDEKAGGKETDAAQRALRGIGRRLMHGVEGFPRRQPSDPADREARCPRCDSADPSVRNHTLMARGYDGELCRNDEYHDAAAEGVSETEKAQGKRYGQPEVGAPTGKGDHAPAPSESRDGVSEEMAGKVDVAGGVGFPARRQAVGAVAEEDLAHPQCGSNPPQPCQPVPDDLRARLEKAMREAEDNFKSCGHAYLHGELCTGCAVDVAEREVRRERECKRGQKMCDLEIQRLEKRAEAAERDLATEKSHCGGNRAANRKMRAERDEARKALAEYRSRWGHIANCLCCPYPTVENCAWCTGRFSDHPHRDTRCSPAGGKP